MLLFPTFFGLFSPDRAVAMTGASLWIIGGKEGPVKIPASAAGVINESGGFETRYLGQEAIELKGRTPERMIQKSLLVEGAIAEFDILETLLKKNLRSPDLSWWACPRVLSAGRGAPATAAALTRRDLLTRCHARKVYDIPYPTACAIGLELDLAEPNVQGVLTIERDWFACATIGAHGPLSEEDGPVGLDSLAHDVAIHLGEATENLEAQHRRIKRVGLYAASDAVGSAPWGGDPRRGEPDAVALTLGARPSVARIADGVRRCCLRLDSDTLDELGKNGLHLCGEGAEVEGLAEILTRRTGLRVIRHAPEIHPVASGLATILENIDTLRANR